jgi:hypothetical protein
MNKHSDIEGLKKRKNAVIALPRSGPLIRFFEMDEASPQSIQQPWPKRHPEIKYEIQGIMRQEMVKQEIYGSRISQGSRA